MLINYIKAIQSALYVYITICPQKGEKKQHRITDIKSKHKPFQHLNSYKLFNKDLPLTKVYVSSFINWLKVETLGYKENFIELLLLGQICYMALNIGL